MKRIVVQICAVILLSVLWMQVVLAAYTTALPELGTTERISLSNGGLQGNDDSENPSISTNGRYVAFESAASNLAPGDTNAKEDVFVRDRMGGTTERVSVSSSDVQGNDDSEHPSISADGRYVAFQSKATNLVAGDTNTCWDVFVRDRVNGTTERVSVSSSGAEGNGDSKNPSISADGRYVAFESKASTLVNGDANLKKDVFVHDRWLGTTERVSLPSVGGESNGDSESPSISSDGRYVAFESDASNLVSGDTNGKDDIFVRDRVNGTTERASVSSGGAEGNGDSDAPVISADGRFVAFESEASNLVSGDTNMKEDVFVRDRASATTERVSVSSDSGEGNGGSETPSISADGRYVAFESAASNLIRGDVNGKDDVFVHDRVSGTTERVSVSSGGAEGNGGSDAPAISADGVYIAFESAASNLVAGDTNQEDDVFLHVRQDVLSLEKSVYLPLVVH